jgi:hypothetical protein
MKNLRKIFHAGLLALGMFAAAESQAQTIPNNFFGQNAWMPDTVGDRLLGGKLHKHWGDIRDSKAQIIRFGGIAPDRDRPTNFQYIKMIDSVRAKGMEPIIQVSYHNGKYSAQQAAQVVQYINGTKGKNIKYWIIGNEPDLEYSFTSASQVANYIKPFATAMKAVDPNILIIGPECAWFNQGIIDGLTSPGGPNDITGKDANGRYYVDIISFHTYPFNGTQSRSDVISKLTGTDQFQDKLVYLNGRIAAANSSHGRTGTYALKTAVTEANVNYKNNASDDVNGVGVNSFIGGQFIAEMFNIGLKNKVAFMNIWSVIEGNNTELNIGYLDRSTGAKKSAYYHFQMMAGNFKGNYVGGTTNNSSVKAFGSNNGQYIQVMVMNQESASNLNYTVRLNKDAIAGNSTLKVNMDAGLAIEYNGVINNQTTLLLTFNSNGQLVKKTEYSITQASAQQAPVVTTYSTTGGGNTGGGNTGGGNTGGGSTGTSTVVTNPNGTTSTLTTNGNGEVVTSVGENGASDFVSMKGFEMNVFPNPAKSKFTIEIDRPNKQEVKFQVEIYDIMGRLIYKQSSLFPERQQKIDLSGNTVAEAVYIVKVREEGDKDNWRTEKVIVFK